MGDRIKAPWSVDQIIKLNDFQRNAMMHPFTCGRRSESGHQWYDNDLGTLVATHDGWICRDCDYTQDWAYDFMAETLYTADEIADLLGVPRSFNVEEESK